MSQPAAIKAKAAIASGCKLISSAAPSEKNPSAQDRSDAHWNRSAFVLRHCAIKLPSVANPNESQTKIAPRLKKRYNARPLSTENRKSRMGVSVGRPEQSLTGCENPPYAPTMAAHITVAHPIHICHPLALVMPGAYSLSRGNPRTGGVEYPYAGANLVILRPVEGCKS